MSAAHKPYALVVSERFARFRLLRRRYCAVPPTSAAAAVPDGGPEAPQELAFEPTAAPDAPGGLFVLALKRRVELERLADRLGNATGLRPGAFLIEGPAGAEGGTVREIRFRLVGPVTEKMQKLLDEGQLQRLA
jgi:hypothetical protein